MSKPPSKLGRMTLVCLCLLGVGLGLFWCGRRTQVARQVEKATARAKEEARLVMVNESTCEWLVSLARAGSEESQSWKVPVGQSAELTLAAGEFRVEQKLISAAGTVPARRFDCALEAGQVYRWRLVNLLSADATERALPLEGAEVR